MYHDRYRSVATQQVQLNSPVLSCLTPYFISCLITVAIGSASIPAFAKEGIMCNHYVESVQRKVRNIKSFGTDLSAMAKQRLFDDLKFDTNQCISECEGEKFRYCNEIAKWIVR